MNVKGFRTFNPFVPYRIEEEELLDLGLGSLADVADNLSEMQRINDLLGGTRALTQHIHPRLLAAKQPYTLLDVGTGAAGFPLRLTRWANRNGVSLKVIALDWSERNLRVAQSWINGTSDISLIRADALYLPAAQAKFDYVISSLFLHHLQPEQAIRLLGQAFQTSRCGLVMSDLVRGWLPYYAFKLVQPVLARSYLTRHDGELSIRRAYTPHELLELARAAGLRQAKVFAHWPWRMTLVVDK